MKLVCSQVSHCLPFFWRKGGVLDVKCGQMLQKTRKPKHQNTTASAPTPLLFPGPFSVTGEVILWLRYTQWWRAPSRGAGTYITGLRVRAITG